jgi:hypothetical protein
MSNRIPKNKKYFFNFIEEAILNPKYSDYIGGRIEIWDDDHPYSIEEIRFFTKKLNEWRKFRDKWDFKEVNDAQIKKIKNVVKEKYHNIKYEEES